MIAEVESATKQSCDYRPEQDAKLLLMTFAGCEAPGPTLKLMVRCKAGS